MKRSQLRQLVKEELRSVLKENKYNVMGFANEIIAQVQLVRRSVSPQVRDRLERIEQLAQMIHKEVK